MSMSSSCFPPTTVAVLGHELTVHDLSCELAFSSASLRDAAPSAGTPTEAAGAGGGSGAKTPPRQRQRSLAEEFLFDDALGQVRVDAEMEEAFRGASLLFSSSRRARTRRRGAPPLN